MNGYVMNASGQGYYQQGNYALAAQEFQNAVQSSPTNTDYLANLAKTRQKMGDTGSAEQLFRQALTINPSHQPSYHGLAELLVQQNRGQEAQRLLGTWAATQPYIPESHVELAWLQREMGQPDAAAQSLQKALQVNPNHATALAHLGQYYQDRGQAGQAVAMFQQSLRADWNQPEVHSRMASAADAAGASHPMSETAMARGVHPHSIPRQQLAFGPSPGMPQFAQMPMMPTPAMAYQSAPPQTIAYQPSLMAESSYPSMQVPGSTAMPGWQPPQQPDSFTMSAPGMQNAMMPIPFGFGSSGTATPSGFEGVTSAPVSNAPNSPPPVPDPAFSSPGNAALPVTSVSQSSVVGNSDSEAEVEAF